MPQDHINHIIQEPSSLVEPELSPSEELMLKMMKGNSLEMRIQARKE